MKPNFGIIARLLLIFCAGGVWGQDKKPSSADVYLQGYLVMEEGIKMHKAGDFAGAYYKLKEARDLFNSVFHSDPTWNPEIVEYRRKKVLEQMETARLAEIERRSRQATSPGTVNPTPPASPPVPATPVKDTLPSQPIASTPAPPPPPKPDRMPAQVRPAIIEDTSTTVLQAPEVVVQTKVREMNQRIRELETKNEALLREIGSKEENLRQLGSKLLDSQTQQRQMLERLKSMETKLEVAPAASKREKVEMEKKLQALVKERDTLKAQLAKATELLTAANDDNAELIASVKEAYESIAAITAERDKLLAEREQLHALINESPSSESVKAITAENIRIKKNLEDLKKQIAALQKEREQEKKAVAQEREAMAQQREADQKLIAELRTQLETARAEVLAIRRENQDYQEQMAALTAKLEVTQRALADTGSEGMTETEARQENNLLHEIILKMLKQQAGRQRAKEQALAQLESNGQLTEALLKDIREMSAPYEMTPAERAVLQATGLVKSDGGGGIEMSMVIPLDQQDPATSPGDTSTKLVEAPKSKIGLDSELRAYATAAETYFRNQQFEAAEENYEKILAKEPQNVHSLCNLAVVQLRQNRVQDAEKNLNRAIAYDYDNDFSHYLLGVVRLRQGKFTEAIKAIEEGLKINPNNAEGHLALGSIYIKQRRFADAEQEFKKTVALNPKCGDAHYNLAVLYFSSERPDLAKQHYRQAKENGIESVPQMEALIRAN